MKKASNYSARLLLQILSSMTIGVLAIDGLWGMCGKGLA